MKVKICGITDLDTALQAVAFGADAIGFVFAKSKREIDPSAAGHIAKALPTNIEKIGVFVNETREKIEEIASQANLTMVQLHGDESPEFCHSLNLPVIKALSIGSEQDLEKIQLYSNYTILVDSPAGKYRGGNGTSFNWDLLSSASFSNQKIILAGGLNQENVGRAIEIVKPYMVDVSSGVEYNGKKDLKKMKVFIETAKQSITQ